jgi:hypothetical protein
MAISVFSVLAPLFGAGGIGLNGSRDVSGVARGDDQPPTSKPSEARKMTGFKCKRCGKFHSGLPLNYRSKAPIYYDEIPEKERARRASLSEEQCIIDGKHYFIAANAEIPIKGSDETFSYTVWVSLSEKNFRRASALWQKKGREKEPPYFGWLSTRLPGYPDTVNLKTMVHTQPVGIRPTIELEPTDHPLAVEQRDGISRERIEQIAELVLHPEP